MAKSDVDVFFFLWQLLEQEKHALKRKLDIIEGEYESRIMELQSDIKKLCHEIDQNQGLVKSTDKERSNIIKELTDQNMRLTTQLKQVTRPPHFKGASAA